jgi:hypothetical protein
MRPTIHGEIMWKAWYTSRKPGRESSTPARQCVGTPPIT